MKKYAHLPCSHRSEFCALCADRPLKSPAEERLIRAALRWLKGTDHWLLILALMRAARAVARERGKK